MPSKTKRCIVLELLLPLLPPLRRPLLALRLPLQRPVLCVPSVADLDTLLSAASSLQSPARRPRRRYSNLPLTRKIGALITEARPMRRLKTPRLLLSLQEWQVFVYPPLPARFLMPGTQTQAPLLI